MEEIIEELELNDCFKDADVVLDVTVEQLEQLRLRIDEEVQRNEIERNRGVDMLAASM